eukprot:scaffold116944_cov36-Phaeocystis_antarctica.AAC.1
MHGAAPERRCVHRARRSCASGLGPVQGEAQTCEQHTCLGSASLGWFEASVAYGVERRRRRPSRWRGDGSAAGRRGHMVVAPG